MSSYIFTSVHLPDAAPDNPLHSTHTHLLTLIATHPAYKSKVNEFMDLFPNGLTSDGIIKIGSLINALLFPEIPKALQRKMAVELFNSLQINQEEANYTNLSEFLLKICSDLVENIDVRSAIGILDLLQSRIADWYIFDATDPSFKQKLGTSIKLEVFDSESVITDVELPEKQHRKAGSYVYYEEKVQFEEDISIKPTQILCRRLK